MKITFIVTAMLLVFSSSSNSSSMSHKDYFDSHLDVLVDKINEYYPGPLSYELSKVALARQILEDGLNKGSEYSAAGTSVGGFNKIIVESSTFNLLIVGRVVDAEGGKFYSFRGPQANICGAVIIGRLFDLYVEKFLKKDQKTWRLAKETSKAICCDVDSFELNHRFYNELDPIKIVERADRLYGPNHEAVKKIHRDSSQVRNYEHGLIIRNPTEEEKCK